MRGAGPGPVDDAADFLDFAAARQGPALRAATVVTGDEDLARRVALEALRRLAGDWDRAREEGPDRRLRTVLFREAVSRAPEHVPVRAERPVPQPAGSGPDAPDDLERRRRAVAVALNPLPARVRAVAALRWLEDRPDPETAAVLGVDLEVVLGDLDTVRRALGAVDGRAGPLPPTDEDARSLVELLADEVVEVDLARPAWDGALARRRTVRRRAAIAGGALLVGGAAALVLRPEDGSTPPPRPGPTPTDSSGRLQTVGLGGATVVLAPEPSGVTRLADYPDAPRLGLPRRLGPGTERPLEVLSPAGSRAPVRAVYLVRDHAGGYQPALLLPRQSPDALVVAMAPLHRTADTGTGTPEPIDLGPSTIADDRHRLVFPQPGAVVVLEVRSARTKRIEVPDDGLVSAGWASDQRTVVASSPTTGWLVDTRTGEVVRSARRVNAGSTGIGVDGGPVTMRVYSERGQLMALRRVPGPDLDPYGDAPSTEDGWVCSGTYFGEVAATGNRFQGLVAVQVTVPPAPRILAASTAPGVPLATFRPLAWAPDTTVLVESRTYDGGTPVDTVLAWDVLGDRLFRVAEVDPRSEDPGAEQAFTGAWAL